MDRARNTTAFAGVPRRHGKPMDMRQLDRTIAWRRNMGERHEQNARRLSPALHVAACPACDGGDSTPFVEVYGFRYRECATCGHLFLANPPAHEDIARMYQGATEQAQVYVGEELFRRRVERIARPKASFCESSAGSRADVRPIPPTSRLPAPAASTCCAATSRSCRPSSGRACACSRR
jgi:hypothetical protein